jgi:nucleoside-diphosphate-sugar epimerase
MKKVLVTGHLGYIGAHLVELLKAQGHFVIGCDINLFEGCAFEDIPQPDIEKLIDFRDLEIEDLIGVDAVMHLAAISNDPMGDLDANITFGINREGTIALAEKAKAAGVPLFLFASSCSIYGKGDTLDIDESGKTSPLTPYAKSKIDAECALEKLSEPKFKTVSLRNATAYGTSPMLRIDLVVNNLLACAIAQNSLRVMSDGSPWRPLIHCRDIARAFVAFLETKMQQDSLIVNVGGNQENYQVKDVVAKIHARIPSAEVVFTGEVGKDPRDYKVNFDRLAEVLPDFKLEYTLDKGIDELLEKYRTHNFSLEDFQGEKFVRLRTIKNRLCRISSYALS